MKNLLSLILVTFLGMTACNNGTDSHAEEHKMQQQAWDEMMVIHDEVMPKMGDINRLDAALQDWAAANKETMANGDLEKISLNLTQLKNADDGMMDWMNGLQQMDALRAKMKHEEIMTYLQEQTKMISKVKENMLSSIKEGNALLSELNAE